MTSAADLDREVERNVTVALEEDIGGGDLTAQLIHVTARARAQVIAREDAILCGSAWFTRCFSKLDPAVSVVWQAQDGEKIVAGQQLCQIDGQARALLTAERSALNFLQMLSGVASKTRHFVDLVAGTRAQVVDTRKTLPGLRLAQKYAVLCGGGGNHRLGLYDGILIKENHILAAGGIEPALANAGQIAREAGTRCQFVQIEVETLDQLQVALAAGAKWILLDNMSLDRLREAVAITSGRAVLEASGNVSVDTVRAIANTGVDRISVGSLTKDVCAIDLSLRLIP